MKATFDACRRVPQVSMNKRPLGVLGWFTLALQKEIAAFTNVASPVSLANITFEIKQEIVTFLMQAGNNF